MAPKRQKRRREPADAATIRAGQRPGAPTAPWAEAVCLFAGAATPLAFHTVGTLGFEATKATIVQVLGLVLLLGWLARRLGALRPPIERSVVVSLPLAAQALLVAVAVQVLIISISSALSIAPAASFWGSYDRIQGVTTLFAWIVLGIGGVVAGRVADRRTALVEAWALASLPVCLYSLVQWARLDPIDWLGQPLGVTSTLGSSTALGTYLAMIAPLTLALLVASGRSMLSRARERGPRGGGRSINPRALLSPYTVWVALLGFQIAVLGMTHVRGAAVGLVAGLGVTVSALLWRFTGRMLALSALGLTVAAMVAGLTLARPGDLLDDSSARQRLLLWQAAGETIAGAGWRAAIGFGPETQATALEPSFPVELADRYPDARYDRVHNLVLDTALTTGAFGVLTLAVMVGVLVWSGVSAIRRVGDEQVPLLVGLLGAISANLAANLYAFDSIATGALLWLCGGLLLSALIPQSPEPQSARAKTSSSNRPDPIRDALAPRARLIATASLAMVALAASLAPWLLGPLVGDLYHTRALALRAGEAPASSVLQELTAIHWYPWQDVYALALGEALVEVARGTAARDSTVPATFDDLFEAFPTGREGLFSGARLAFARAIEISPRDPYGHLHLARLWSVWSQVARDEQTRQDRLVAAVESYDRALALGPRRLTVYDEAGIVLTRLGRPEAALERFRQADALDEPSAERLARMGDAELVRGDRAAARSLYERALTLNRDSAVAAYGLSRLALGDGDSRSALEYAQRAARLDMRNWEYHRHLAVLYRDLGDWEQALVEARSARRFAPAWEWDDLSALIESVRR